MAKKAQAQVEITAENRGVLGKLRETRAHFARFGADLQKHILGKEMVDPKKGFWGGAGAVMVGNIASSAAGGVVDMLAGAARSTMDFRDQLVRLQLTANKTPGEMEAYASTVRDASAATGIGKDQIVEGASAFVALTGDMNTAAASTLTWARAAQATNTPVADLARVSAALGQNMGIAAKDTEAVLSGIAAQGKAGAVELKDLAALLPQIAPQWAPFKGGGGMQGVAEMGAALQVVKRGFGDAGETVTGLQSLLTALVKNAARFQAGRIKVFDVDPKTHIKTMRSVLQIVDAIGNSRLMKDPTKLEKAFGRVEAYRAFLQLQQNKSALEEFMAAAKDSGVIQRDLTTYLQSDAGKFTATMNELKNTIADTFTPDRIRAFADVLEGVAAKVGPIAAGIGAIADKVGDTISLGQDIAEAFSSNANNNPFKDELFDSYGIADPNYKGRVTDSERLRRTVANRDAYDRVVSAIMAAPDKETANQIAVVQSFSNRNNTTPGATGAATAARAYLTTARVTPGRQQEIWQQHLASSGFSAMRPMTDAIAKSVADGIAKGFKQLVVNVDSKPLVDAHRGSSQHARRPGG